MKKYFSLLAILISFNTFATNHIVNNLNDNGPGSLRNQITMSMDGDTVSFASHIANGKNDTIYLDSALKVNSSIIIIGTLNSTDTLVLSGQSLHQIMYANLNGNSRQSLEIQNIAFIDGSNLSSEAGALFFRGDSLTCNNLFFKFNSAGGAGAVSIFSEYGTSGYFDYMSFKNCKFYNNTAIGGSSGALNLYSSETMNVFIEDCEFKFNSSPSEGGAIRALGDRLKVELNRSKVDFNTASGDGGGIYLKSTFGDVQFFLNNSTIDYNSSQKNGGGIYCLNKSYGTKLSLNNSSVSFNLCSQKGGGIYNQIQSTSTPYYSQINSQNSKINGNSANSSGGGIYFNSSDSTALFMKNSEVNGNSAIDGGGVNFYGKLYVDVDKSEFRKNTASSDGGGLFFEGNTFYGSHDLFFKETVFSQNVCQSDGGAISYIGFGYPELTVEFCELDSNVANSGRGGAIYYGNQSRMPYLKTNNTTYSRNIATYGGAIYMYSKYSTTLVNHMDIENITVVDNEALNFGGGICLVIFNSSQPVQSNLVIKNSTFYNNIKGGIYTRVNNGAVASEVEIKGSLVFSNDTMNLFTDSIISGGYNAFEDNVVNGSKTTDLLGLTNSQLNLNSLQFNGGFGKTVMPKTSSVLYNSGNPSDISKAQNWNIKGIREIGACEHLNLAIIYDTIFACRNYPSPSGNYLWNNSGDYQDQIISNPGDTVFFINLTVGLKATQTLVYPFLRSNDTGATYRWLDCSNGYSVISGATSQWFKLTANGSYAVEVSKNGCTDTTSCISINNVSVKESFKSKNELKIYPNPTSTNLTIEIPEGVDESAILIVRDVNGRKVFQKSHITDDQLFLDFSPFKSGMYIIELTKGKTIYRSIAIKN
ncbi:MAG: T9SS type A sorting domain-containing protein [Flavobacteriales bacterium]